MKKLATVKAALSGTPAWEYKSKGIVDHHTRMGFFPVHATLTLDLPDAKIVSSIYFLLINVRFPVRDTG